ncbi:hypothetical protein BHE74_00041977 [Ensete ventricosum]|nr:hypothetical protein BHE74_00041977 [Ensete ventricosum]RZS18377.1 hypothetical protein BHM03_00050634 [Ensete ventricosum]
MAAFGELACTYAALLLHDDGIPITSEKISVVVKAAKLTIDSYWPPLFAKLLEKRSVDDLILSVGSGSILLLILLFRFVVLTARKSNPEPHFVPEYLDVLAGGGGSAVAVSAAPAAAGAAPAAAPAAEEKKEEPKEESDDDMGFSLFD